MSKFVKLAAVLAAGVVALGSAASAKTLRLNHNNPEDHPLHKSMQFMAERVEERMFSFDQLTRLSGDDLRTVLEQFEAETIHFAVQGSSGELRERMLAVLQEVYPDYRAVAGRADLAQIKRAQQELLVATKRLAQVGEIVLERRPLSPAAKVVAQ